MEIRHNLKHGGEVKITFLRIGREVEYKKEGLKTPIHTECKMYVNGDLFHKSKVIKHFSDTDDPKYGRKLALTKLLKIALWQTGYKSLRTEIWRKFHEHPIHQL